MHTCFRISGGLGMFEGQTFHLPPWNPRGYFQSIFFFFEHGDCPVCSPLSQSPPLRGIELKDILKNKEFFSGVVPVKICTIREYFTFYKLLLLPCFRETRPGLPLSFVTEQTHFSPVTRIKRWQLRFCKATDLHLYKSSAAYHTTSCSPTFTLGGGGIDSGVGGKSQ